MGLVLASTSPTRRLLLERLGLPFTVVSPQTDETALPDETPEALVRRLSEAKARAVADRFPQDLILGSDQVAELDGALLGKPGTHEAAAEQLRRASGRRVRFHTGLCLYNSVSGSCRVTVVPFAVEFRALGEAAIQSYLYREKPYDCAGSFRSEGLGIALFRRMEGEDPTALMGLPLIALTSMLELEGARVL